MQVGAAAAAAAEQQCSTSCLICRPLLLACKRLKSRVHSRSCTRFCVCLRRCKLYGVDVTTFEYADEVGANYTGGLYCCEDGQRCAVSGPSLPPEKTYYLKYTIHYVDWNPTVVPLRTYIFDVTDNGKRGGKKPYGCRVRGLLLPASLALLCSKPCSSCRHQMYVRPVQ